MSAIQYASGKQHTIDMQHSKNRWYSNNMQHTSEMQRAIGALSGLAIGDALGMPTQSMSADSIRQTYGYITDFVAGAANQPIAPHMSAATITDDTEQALLLAQLLIEGEGHIDAMHFATQLLAWEDRMIAKGSRDLLGPSTKMALEAVRAGADPTTTGKTGTTNGAAMRVAPVGVAVDLCDSARFAQVVRESVMVTHNTWAGWQAASLVAAAVSAGVNGADTTDALQEAIQWVDSQPMRGSWTPKASVLTRVQMALEATASLAHEDVVQYLRHAVGTSVESNESVACACVIAQRWAHNPFEGLCIAANLGGDTDTIGAIAGAILGASSDISCWPERVLAQVNARNHLDLPHYARQLLHMRHMV